MMSSTMVTILRLVHVLAGVLWVGAVVFIAVFLLPTVRALGPTGGAVMQHLALVRRMPVYLMSGVILTILSGLTLYWNDSVGFSSAWLSSGPGRTYGVGAVLAIITGVLGMAVNIPTTKRLAAIMATARESGGPPSAEQVAEIQRLQARLTLATNTAAVLLVLAAAAMAVARYVP